MVEKHEVKTLLENLSMDGMVTPKLILSKSSGRARIGLIWLRIGSSD